MKKILLSVLCLMLLTAINVQAETVTGVAADNYGSATISSNLADWIVGDVTFSFAKAEGAQTAPAFNKAGDVRAYAKNTITVSCASGNLTEIVFNLSAQGLKRLTDLTPDSGETTIDAANKKVTWTGNASTVVLLVGENAVYGTEGSSKAGQICFNSISATFEIATTGATLEAPTSSVESGILYNITNVELGASDGEIHYTIDGTEPTAESPVYSEAIAINNFGATTVVKAIAIDGEEYSNVSTFSYNLQVAVPTFSPDGGVYTGFGYGTEDGYLKISTATTGARVSYTYTVNGEETTRNHYSANANVTLSETSKVVARAFYIQTINEVKDTVWSASVTKYYTISPKAPFKAATAITSGKKYLISANDALIADHLYESSTYGYLYTQDAVVNTLTRKDGTESSKFIETNEFYGFTITETETEGEYTIQDAYGRYLYMSGTYNSFNVKADISTIGDGAIWTITIDDEGVATIVNKEMSKTVAYSTQYESFGAYTSDKLTDAYIFPVLYEMGSYPKLTFSPENDSVYSSFSTFTVTCENGIASNESDELYPIYNWYTDFEYNYDDNMFNLGEQIDANTYSFTPLDEPYGNKTYSITLPEGLFTLDPGGYFEQTSEYMNVTFKVEDLSILEVIYANPNGEEALTSLQYLYFEFNQDIFDNVKNAAITDEEGNSYPLTVTYTDEWGQETPYSALCLKTAEPITAPGEYTFVLSKDYVYAGTDTKIAEDVTYYFTIKEPLKIVSTTPANNATVESLSDITLTFNQTMVYPNGDYCTVWGPNGEEYLFSLSGEDAEGNELPMGTWRLVAEAPLTAAGEYILYLEDSFFMSYSTSGTEYSAMQQFTFFVEGSAIEGDVDADGIVDVADVTSVVSMILDNTTATTAGDVDGDGIVDVADVTKIISIILGGDESASEAPAKAAATRAGATSTVSAEIENNELLVNISNPSFPFTAVQFDIVLPEGVEVVTDGEFYDVFLGSRAHTRHSDPECALQPDGSLRVVIMSLRNVLFSGTEGDVAVATLKVNGLADGNYEYGIKNVTIANEKSEKEVLDDYTAELIIANGITGIGSIDAEGTAADGAIYDLAGRKVSNTVKGGIYIQNGKKFIAE